MRFPLVLFAWNLASDVARTSGTNVRPVIFCQIRLAEVGNQRMKGDFFFFMWLDQTVNDSHMAICRYPL